MRKSAWTLGLGLMVAAAAVPAAAKDAAKKATPLRYEHTYEQALEEAKERGCVIFATFHIDH